MVILRVNGSEYSVAADKNLLDVLRDELNLTGTKNGCAEGACGACMVIADGKAVRACLLTAAKAVGKDILTIEGLSEYEKEVYGRAFAVCGAVQCGFCIPGMVMSAKGLIDVNPRPTTVEIKQALKGNICRCTGYAKIEQAISLAAKILRGEAALPVIDDNYRVGSRMPRIDAIDKVLGDGLYVDDLKLPGMLFAAVLRPPKARILLKAIDSREASAIPGVVAVLTADDVPGERYQGHIIHDWPVMVACGEETRCIGDALVIVAAESKQLAKEAVKKIKLDYEELSPLAYMREAMKPEAPRIHHKGNILTRASVKRGDAAAAISIAKYIVEATFITPPTEHAYMEPESALAVPEAGGRLTVYTATQSVYDDHKGIVGMLGVAADKVRVISKYVGGGFGGKEDLIAQHHAALLAWYTKRPVKLTLGRQESINVHPKRHAMELKYTVACDADAKITAVKAEILADTGAYASLGGPVVTRACTHAAGPYNIANVDITGQAIYTNNPPAGAFRGFGVTQSCFAMESCLNKLAVLAGISSWQIRYLNAIEPGGVLPNGQIADDGTAFKETLLAVRDDFEQNRYAGIACAMKNSGIGVGLTDIGRVKLNVEKGKVVIYCSAACMGQGIATALLQIVAETAGLPSDLLIVAAPDTALTPDSGTSTASRQTVFSGEAARLAAQDLRDELESLAGDRQIAVILQDLSGQSYYREYSGVTDPMNSDKTNPVSHIAYGYATQVVVLDEKGYVKKVIAAQDVGRAINPLIIEGQIEGGVVMGLGYALTEDFPLHEGVPKAKFGTLGLWRANAVPEMINIIIEKNPSDIAYGAKGVGEIVTIPTAPAVAGEYYRLDGEFRTSLPLLKTAYRE